MLDARYIRALIAHDEGHIRMLDLETERAAFLKRNGFWQTDYADRQIEYYRQMVEGYQIVRLTLKEQPPVLKEWERFAGE